VDPASGSSRVIERNTEMPTAVASTTWALSSSSSAEGWPGCQPASVASRSHLSGRTPEVVAGRLEAGLEQALLGREVAVDESDVDAGVVGDVAHGRRRVPVLGEPAASRREQGLPGFGRIAGPPLDCHAGSVTDGRV
jgi:hypothetical protein